MASDFDPPYKFVYPPEWSDRERMHYLLAPVPPGKALTVNDTKITFWSNLVKSSSRELKRPTFTERELRDRFKWNRSTSPSCLSSVIESMERAGEITRMSEIRQSVKQRQQGAGGATGWVSWGVGMIARPVNWALKNYLSSGAGVDEEYVVLSTVKELANRVIAEHQRTVEYQSTDRIMKHSSFIAICKEATSTETDSVAAIEEWLLYERRIAKATDGKREVVKFCEKGESITETDIGIMSIKDSIKTLSNQAWQLQETCAQLKQRAVEQFKAKNKQGALKLLRRQKVMEASLHKKEGALDNLQNILHQIQMAETDAMVYEAYRRGAEALKNLRESSGFTVDDVNEVADNLQDALEANQEISDALNMASQEMNPEDADEDLEAELMALLKPEQGQPAAAVSPPSVKQVKSTTTELEDNLEARLASLSLGGGSKLPEKTTTSHEQQTTEHLQPHVREKSQPTSGKKLSPIPA